MRNLLLGIIDFRKTLLPQYRAVFQQLAKSQSPDCLFFACADSRVVPNLFASTKPGELFTIRNVGNLVPPSGFYGPNETKEGVTNWDTSIGAAIEFSTMGLKVTDIIICGHSNCGAMKALLETKAGKPPSSMPHLVKWLQAGQTSLELFSSLKDDGSLEYKTLIPGLGKIQAKIDNKLPIYDQLSQINAMLQLENLLTYDPVRERAAKGDIRLHCWWFDIGNAEIHSFSTRTKKFVLMDEDKAKELLDKFFKDDAVSFVPPWMAQLNKQ